MFKIVGDNLVIRGIAAVRVEIEKASVISHLRVVVSPFIDNLVPERCGQLHDKMV